MASKQNLRVLVPVKRVLDYQLKPKINATRKGIEATGYKFSINPFDDIAIEQALNIPNAVTHAVSIGSTKNEDILKNCLAKGINNVTLIENNSNIETNLLDPLTIAKILKKFVLKNEFDLILLGKQSIDNDYNNTGQMLAGLLDWPQVTNASKVEFLSDEVKVSREIDGGTQTLISRFPLVITCDLRLNTPRYVGLSKLMKVKRQKIPKLTLTENFNDIDLNPTIELLELNEPKPKKKGIKVPNVDALLENLKREKIL
ncbi:hypothetical protein KAFR_0B04050 [Kazachstania africana CBS 2517]|uniref:Probable electron transfer flavoprotein subunit beta n=1 Tax=Kazachstania africana (strain ATCC 22294 / BCRC 22015 / CBS 2517 / CECT 1963 / NBRC 1671 / NRRL Y-8276) TaxID=1071382 RepID=H2AQQ1_KAZAF|nr:hypothetical protein KAFR_0B04050 [Kazachstania africana CBS 2517]CCF56701.1 hypothetical protein KAFR_0B04050 [Kazachstania africana CBS 2517]